MTLRAKREKPRRNEGRVQHQRMKPKTVEPTAEQKRYHAWLRQGARCEVCNDPTQVLHHLLSVAPGKVGRRDHWFMVNLCPEHHNCGTKSVHLLGSEAAFYVEHGIDLVQVAVANLQEYRNEME